MLNLRKRSDRKELLDNDHIPFRDIIQNLKELNLINTYLGGHAINLKGIRSFIPPYDNLQEVHIVEIGCGGGDNLHYLKKKLPENFSFTGIDIKESCIRYARTQYPGIEFIESDYREVTFQKKPHIIFSSLFCHHFTDDDLVTLFQWKNTQAQWGFFVNDLQRNKIAYYSIRFITRLLSRSYLVKNDAPLSVLRSFKKKEIKGLLRSAGIKHFRINWQWAFRYLVLAQHEI